MNTETKTSLSDDTIKVLQRLVQLNIDSRDGLNEAADHIENDGVAMMLRDLAVQRNDQVSEVRTLVSANHKEPESSGSMMGAAHRTWMDLRTALGGGVSAVLTEAERGESYLKAKYEDTLKDTAGGAVNDVLSRHFAAVTESHDRVRVMRDKHLGRDS